MVAEIDRDYISTRPTKLWPRLSAHTLLQGRPLTTRGRWFNNIILGQFRMAESLPQMREVRKPIFILGTGRSGTTILGKVMSMHADTVWLNEPKALWYAIYPKEDLIGSYSRGSASYFLDASDVTPEVSQAAHRLYGYCLALSFEKRIVDKYPEMIFRIPFLQAIFPDAKFVFITRDGRDTALSIQTWSDSNRQDFTQNITPESATVPALESHDWWGVDQRKWELLIEEVIPQDPALAPHQNEIATLTRQQDMAAVEWTATMRQGIQVAEEDPGLMYTVRYEDLVTSPRQTLGAIFDYCELPKDEVALAYAEQQLSPRPPKPPLHLDPAIEPVFNETMDLLGYPTGGAS